MNETNLLDSILDASNGPNVVSVENNTDNVNYGGESAIRSARGQRPGSNGGSWDAAEYGISLAEAQARWDNAQTPEARERVIADLKQRALKRASLDSSNGKVRMMSGSGVVPWHSLGTVIDGTANSEEAIVFSGLDWPIVKTPLYYAVGEGEGIEWRMSPDAYGIVRQDTGEMLGSVGSRYVPIQNKEAFAFLDGVLEQFGAKYETAGSLYNGSKVWILAHLPKQDFEVNGGDKQECYVLFENVHDGSGAAQCYPTSVRVVCANTLRMAGKSKQKGLSIRHSGNVKAKIKNAQNVLGIAVQEFSEYKEQAEELYRKPLDVRHYADDVLDAVLDITAAEALQGADLLAATLATTQAEQELLQKQFSKRIERREELLVDILDRYERSNNGMNGIRGTAWAAFNAVTEHADHSRPQRQSSNARLRDSRRFESVIAGDADDLKQTALQIALAAN